MNYKILSAKKRKFIALINKKEINNLEVNALINELVGKHRIDYMIEDKVIVELKAVETINKIYEAQLLTFFRATNKRIGLLINFNLYLLKKGVKRLII